MPSECMKQSPSQTPADSMAHPTSPFPTLTSKTRLIKENVSLFKVFQIAASYDDICYEWVNGFPIMFDMAFPYLMNKLEHQWLNTAIVNTFLKILSERPDTFISRKVGVENAKKISQAAKHVLELGGAETKAWKRSIAQLGQEAAGIRQRLQPWNNRRHNSRNTRVVHA